MENARLDVLDTNRNSENSKKKANTAAKRTIVEDFNTILSSLALNTLADVAIVPPSAKAARGTRVKIMIG
jgi:hypothetical protein